MAATAGQSKSSCRALERLCRKGSLDAVSGSGFMGFMGFMGFIGFIGFSRLQGL